MFLQHFLGNCATVRRPVQNIRTSIVFFPPHACRFGLPRELIRDVSGQVAFEEEMSRLKPLRVSDQDISDASVKLVSNHASAFADQRIVAQRHQVTKGGRS